MKNVLKLKSNLLSMLTMLAIGLTSLSLTACSDDDDDKGGSTATQTVEINGTKTTIASAEAYYDEEFHYWHIKFYDADDDRIAYVEIPDYYLGKVNNLTDDLVYKFGDGEDDIANTGIKFYSINSTYLPDEGDFKSGTLKVTTNKSAKSATVEANGVTIDDHNFTISYSGKYTEIEAE